MTIADASVVRPCPCCGSSQYVLDGALNGWAMARCVKCCVRYTCDVPTAQQLSALYNKVYEPGELYQAHLEERELLERQGNVPAGYYRNKIFLNRYRPFPGDKLLEVGCGVGSFLAAAKDKGWQVEGIDLSGEALSRSQAIHGLPVRCGKIEDFPLEAASYKAIVCWEVMEHLASPGDFLAEVRSLLRPDGILACSVPNWSAKVPYPKELGPTAVPPIHLNFWDCHSLRLLFELNGFQIARLAPKRILISVIDHRRRPVYFTLKQISAFLGLAEGATIFAVASPVLEPAQNK